MQLPSNTTAVTHVYTTPANDRTYLMHFVVLKGLTARARYFYKVKSGAADCKWSAVFSFRAGYTADNGGPTKVGIFGDMGVYSWNNMNNLKEDAATGLIDLVVSVLLFRPRQNVESELSP
jgi:hypothetical protein